MLYINEFEWSELLSKRPSTLVPAESLNFSVHDKILIVFLSSEGTLENELKIKFNSEF